MLVFKAHTEQRFSEVVSVPRTDRVHYLPRKLSASAGLITAVTYGDRTDA